MDRDRKPIKTYYNNSPGAKGYNEGFQDGITQGRLEQCEAVKREAWEKMRGYCDCRIIDGDDYCCLDNNEKPCDFNQCPAMKDNE